MMDGKVGLKASVLVLFPVVIIPHLLMGGDTVQLPPNIIVVDIRKKVKKKKKVNLMKKKKKKNQKIQKSQRN